MPPTIGVWFVVAIIALVAAGTVLMAVYKIATAQPMSSRVRSEPLRSAVPMNERVEESEPHTNATEQARASSTNELEPNELILSADEIIAVQRMIGHNATAINPSKTTTIQAGFGIKRGGGPRYQRASDIYDALFGVPVNGPQFQKADGTKEPASYPVSGR